LKKEPEIDAKKYSARPIAKVRYSPVLKNSSNPTIVMPRERTLSNVLANILIPKMNFQ
jgi:hypothetical protein